MRGRRPTGGSGAPFRIASPRQAARRQIAVADAASGCRRSGGGCRSPRALQAARADRGRRPRTPRERRRAGRMRHPRRRGANIDQGRAGQTSSQERLATHHPAAVRKHRGIGRDRACSIGVGFCFRRVLMRGRRIADQHTARGSLTRCSRKNRCPSRRRSRNGAVIEPHAVLEESHRIAYLPFTCSSSVSTKAS